MLRAIEKFASSFPNEGMALHGTNLSRAAKIRLSGLHSREGNHVMAIPVFSVRELYASSKYELLERLIGAALWACHFAFQKSDAFASIGGSMPQEEPAVVIFRGNIDQQFRYSYDGSGFDTFERPKGENAPLFGEKIFPVAKYRTFGREIVFPMPPDTVLSVVSLSHQEMLEIIALVNSLSLGQQTNFNIGYHFMGRLAKKTLSALVECTKAHF